MRIEASTRGLLMAFFRQKAKFLALFLLTVLGGLAFIAFSPAQYESKGEILVKFGDNAKPDVAKLDRTQHEDSPNEHSELIESYVQILQSHDLLAAAIADFGVQNLYPDLIAVGMTPAAATEKAIARLTKGDLLPKSNPKTDIIEISLLNRNAKVTAPFLKHVLELFIARQTEVFNKPQMDFVNEQLQHAADQLAVAQQQLQDFKSKSGISTLDGEITQLMQEKSDADSTTLQEISEAQSRVDALKSREAELLTKYNATSPNVVQLHENIAVAEEQLHAKQADLKAGTKMNYGHAHGGTGYAGHVADLDKRINELEAQRSQYNDLVRQVQIAEEDYRNYKLHLEEARVNQTLNQQSITRITILDEPSLPIRPAFPNKPFILLLTVLGGLVLGIGVVIFAESSDERFSTPEQVTRILQVPIMATFPVPQKR